MSMSSINYQQGFIMIRKSTSFFYLSFLSYREKGNFGDHFKMFKDQIQTKIKIDMIRFDCPQEFFLFILIQIWCQYILIMSKPFSIRTEPWTSFDKQSYSIFSDDFVHEKLLTVKVNQVPTRGAINLKGQVSKSGDSYKTAGEIKLWFPIWNSRSGHLYFRSKNDEFKVHYDDGLKEITNSTLNYYNLYASYRSTNQFKNIVLKAGANLLAKNYKLDNRVRVQLEQSGAGAKAVSTGHKFTWAKNEWSFDAYEIFDWKNHAIVNNAFRVGYSKGDNDFFIRGENETLRPFKDLDFKHPDSYFTKFTFDYVRKVDDLTRVGLEAELTGRTMGKSSFVVQRSIPSRQVGVKAKVSTDKSVALCYQAVLNNYGKWTVGFEVSDIGKTNRSRYGLQLDLNL